MGHDLTYLIRNCNEYWNTSGAAKSIIRVPIATFMLGIANPACDKKTCSKYKSEEGITKVCEYYSNADGKADKILTYKYDANGNMTEQRVDSDANGNADRIWTWKYDAKGNLTEEIYDSNADGNADWIRTQDEGWLKR